jgi:hypothetical protein
MITSLGGRNSYSPPSLPCKENLQPCDKKATFPHSKRSESKDSDNHSIVQSLQNKIENRSQLSQRMHAPYSRQLKMMSLTNLNDQAHFNRRDSIGTPDKKSTASRLKGDQSIHQIKQPRFRAECSPGRSVSQLSQLDEKSVNSIFVSDIFGKSKVFCQEAARKSKAFSAKKGIQNQVDPSHVSLFKVNIAGSKINEINDEADENSNDELLKSKKKVSILSNLDNKSKNDFRKIERTHERSPSCDLKLNTGNHFDEEGEFGLVPVRLQFAEFADDTVSPRKVRNFSPKRKDSHLKAMPARPVINKFIPIPFNFRPSPEYSPAPIVNLTAIRNLNIHRNISRHRQMNRMDADFEIIKVLGTGSYGKVYQCRSRFDGLYYAIKTIDSQSITDGKHEASILAYISSIYESSHIVRYYSSWAEDSVIYIVTELCLENIEVLLDSSNLLKVSESLIRKLLKHICKALKKLHGDQIVHLDIKPENILLSKTSKYKLCDFGLATLLNIRKEVAEMTEGDSRYLARELLDENKWFKLQSGLLDFTKADIFSLGLAVYAIMAKHCFTVPKDGPLWQNLRRGKLNAFENLPEYSINLKAIVRKMLDPNSALRPSAGEILCFLSSHRLEDDFGKAVVPNERLLAANNSHLSYDNQNQGSKFK